jgi:hypothetical protein
MIDEIEKARIYRSDIALASDFFISNEDDTTKSGEQIEWEDLEQLPSWVKWSNPMLNQLINVAGTVFMLPSIKLWLESDRIESIQTLIGNNVYEFLLNFTYIDTVQPSQVEIGDIEKLLQTSGSSVLLSTLEERLHPWVRKLLPECKSLLNKNIATELLNHSLYVVEKTHKSKQEQNQDSVESP